MEGRNVEELRNPLAPFDFHQQYLAAAGGEGQRQRGRHGGLPGAALPGDDMQSGLGQSGRPSDCAAVTRFGRHLLMLTKRSGPDPVQAGG